ncbi:MAG TPA: peptidase S10 [Terriglobia bacterium]|nr:peptidase S10 [Terriglobia bacterium]
MRLFILKAVAVAFILSVMLPAAARAQTKVAKPAEKPEAAKPEPFKPEQVETHGSVTVSGQAIDYDAYAGTLVVHPKKPDDDPEEPEPSDDPKAAQPPEASMFYVAYFKTGEKAEDRPITFFYNGGPGSSSVWLHMGAFGPRRVDTADHSHTPPAPYRVVNNQYSLLDVTDLVFVDAPGTGFSRIQGKDAKKAFYSVDGDANAFADFITQFLSKYGRWNSAKYLFGESYGTTRSAVLANLLETDHDIDLNGVMLLSQILNFDLSPDGPETNPGIDLPYELALPTYAATAWYHHKLPNAPKNLQPLLDEVEHFAMAGYAEALEQGAALPADQKHAMAEKLHQYTGLPVAYILKANLRIDGGEFEKNLQDSDDLTTGRLDTRFSGPTYDPLSKEAEYDPQSADISAAYVAAFNDYVRKELKYGEGKEYKPEMEIKTWNFLHQPPGADQPEQQSTNVLPDLAQAMKYNPELRVMLNSGYFDLATPFYEGIYEMNHLALPEKLQKNIEIKHYQSGHMVYAHLPSLKELHDNVAAFIRQGEQHNP